MGTVHDFSFGIDPAPRVFNMRTLNRLAEANRVTRQLRGLGCRVLSMHLGSDGEYTEIVVDRNPHVVIHGCASVHITCRGSR